ncbi:MAG: ferredoxin [Methylococcus sp.]|jgi:3-phenylpropionate/trans-cinnamate dioxygenase ferredoxin subunit|nr:MAG: ferredoxin [Methylococcus sp.]
MSEWISVIREQAFADGEHVMMELDGSDVAVFNLAGEYYAIEDQCSHDGMELASGEREGDEIICPRHGARFCIRTGKALTPPAYEDIHSFPLRIEDGFIQIRDDRWD